MTKITLISYGSSSFIQQDYESLSKYYDVEHVTFAGIFDIWKLVTTIRTSDISYTWFASAGAFFAVIASKIFRKKSIVVAGGGDVANEPEIDYGVGTQDILRQLMRTFALKYADIVLPVSKFTQHETERYTKHNIKMVYNAVDSEKFKLNGEKEELVLTVGNKIKLKGIDTFIAAARRCSDIMFMIVGMSEDLQAELERYCNIPDNLMLVGNVSYNDMVQYYQRAKVYCQLSYRESFGMALAEAMACGCVPVVTNRGAISEVVGSEGIYVPFGDVDATVEGIKNAFESRNFYPRERIDNNFSLSRRDSALKHIIDYNLKDSRTRNRLQKATQLER